MMLNLRDRPERRDVYTDEKKFKEREESLPVILKKVTEAKDYFLEMHSKVNTESIDIKEVNTGFIHTLDECIDFLEKKDKKNHGLISTYYEELTGRPRNQYSSTLGRAKQLTRMFFDPKWNDMIRIKVKQPNNNFPDSDTREQAYRICSFLLGYLEVNEAGYDSFSEKTKLEITEVLGTPNRRTIIKHNFDNIEK